MNKKFFYVAACFILMLTACEMNTSDNGDLDGFWQMTSVDSLDTGTSTDTRTRRIFWAVQANMLEMRDLSDVNHHYLSIIFRFRLADGRLALSNPIADDRDISDSIITSAETLSFYGLHDLSETFDVERLDSKKMVLRSEHHLRFHFRKY